jgi:hypothetical protein
VPLKTFSLLPKRKEHLAPPGCWMGARISYRRERIKDQLPQGEDRGSVTTGRGSRISYHRERIEDQLPQGEDRGSVTAGRESRISYRRERIKDQLPQCVCSGTTFLLSLKDVTKPPTSRAEKEQLSQELSRPTAGVDVKNEAHPAAGPNWRPRCWVRIPP